MKVEPVGEFELKGIRRPLAAYKIGVRRDPPSLSGKMHAATNVELL